MSAPPYSLGCASYRVEFDSRREMRLVMTIPCPLKDELAQVDQLVARINADRSNGES